MLEEGKLPSLPPFKHLPSTGRCITKWKLHVSAKNKEQNTACWYNLTTIISAICRIMKWVFWACIPYYVFLPVSVVPCRSWRKREDETRTAGLHHKLLVRQEHSFISGRIIVTNHFLTPDFQEGSTKYLQKVRYHRRGGKEVSLSCRKILAGLIKWLCHLTNCILASDPVEIKRGALLLTPVQDCCRFWSKSLVGRLGL